VKGVAAVLQCTTNQLAQMRLGEAEELVEPAPGLPDCGQAIVENLHPQIELFVGYHQGH
jgi:hypothetical protein